MAYKFPWTNYHELNLDWILKTVKELFAKTEQNNAVVEQYDSRLTEVELTADNAQTAAGQALENSTAALDLAQNAQTTATQAQQAAGQAQQAAGQAQQAAGQALEAAATAQQTATQAQQTAQNFDGRITQAENNAASALQAAQAFDEQVQGAITAANNANEAATAALTTATEANRRSAETADELEAQRDTLEGIVADGVESLQDAAQNATEEIEALGQSVLDSIPADYTALSELVDKKADVIYNTAAGNIASFNDGADDMKIKRLVVNIEPVQDGSGWTGLSVERCGKNLFPNPNISGTAVGLTVVHNEDEQSYTISGTSTAYRGFISPTSFVLKAGTYTVSRIASSEAVSQSNLRIEIRSMDGLEIYASSANSATFTLEEDTEVKPRLVIGASGVDFGSGITYRFQLELGATATEYKPFQSSQISVNWKDEAGTVYGGTLDLVSGKLTVTHKVATPIEYQLTPQEVKTLYQYNNIWSDAGSVDVEYPADTKTYIDNKFAELQALILEH